MTINGESQTGTIIDAEKQNRIFTILSGITFTLQNITLTNGTSVNGGAILNYGTVTINQSTLTQNTATSGGAIYNDKGTVTINQTTLTQNTANTAGGAIYNYKGTLTINQTTLTQNTANTGGAIFNFGTLTINQTTLTQNTAGTGGAIYNYKGTLTINQSTLTQNTAYQWDGGAIDNYYGTVTINQSTLTQNTAKDWGGAINNYYGTVTINQSTLTQNTANTGGAIYNDDGTSEIHFSRIIGNNNIDVYRNGGTVNATLNWWGSNFLGTYPISENRANNNVIIDPWVILTVNATPNTIKNGETSTITADFNHINGGAPLTGGNIPDGNIKLDVLWGSFNNSIISHSFTGNTTAGVLTATFYASEGSINLLYNPVEVTATADIYTTTNTESAYIYINPVAYLNITKTANVTNANVGDLIQYNITITNNGPDNATYTIQLEDLLPLGTEFVNASPAQDETSPSTITWNNVLASFGIPALTPGMSLSILVNMLVLPSASGTTLTNKANITSIEYPYFNETTVNVNVNQAFVELNKTANNTRPQVGETVLYTIVAKNNGPNTANNLIVTDTLPTGLDFVSCTGGGVWDPVARTVTWPSAVVLNGTNVTYYLNALVNSTSLAGTHVTNALNETHAEYPGNSTSNCTVYVPKADLYIQITSNNNNPTVGETFTLRYKLGNKGPDDALNVTITIPIPDGFVISKIEGDGNWTIVGNNIMWTFNNVTVGDPDLYVSGWTRWAGNFQFGASILSDTYNLNTQGVNSFSLNAAPQVNAATVTSNTVGMQNTGTPITGIILAILMVLGGFINNKKKQ